MLAGLYGEHVGAMAFLLADAAVAKLKLSSQILLVNLKSYIRL